MFTKIPNRTIEEVYQLKLDGYSLKEIAANIGISLGSVINICNRKGLTNRQRITSSAFIQSLIDDYESGLVIKEISELRRVSRDYVSKVLNDNGIKVRMGSRAFQAVLHNPFSNLEDPNTQYWLGWLASDGCLYQKRGAKSINLICCKDPEVLTNYINFIDVDLPIYKSKQTGLGHYPKGTVSFCSEEVFDFLCDLGITPKKSLTLKLAMDISFSFLCGYYDGNGWLNGKSSCRLCTASPAFSNQLVSFLQEHGFSPHIYIKKGTSSELHEIKLCSREQMNKLQSFMYKGLNFYLKRKKPNLDNDIA